uniref:STAS domain-containing protein n=1 Tax=Acrobeloides nanus TaxID=290746 RepID=A0A914C075_9BILA
MNRSYTDDYECKFRRRRSENVKRLALRVQKRFTLRSLKRTLVEFIPIIGWLPKYDWKGSFFGDLSGGLTMAVFAVPQGIAQSVITGVEPVYGLYTAIFPSFLYILFGNSKHNALGGFAVLSLMTKAAINKVMALTATKYNRTHYSNDSILLTWNDSLSASDFIDVGDFGLSNNSTDGLSTVMTEEWTDGLQKIHIATTIMFLSGVFQILMGIFRLDFLACYLSEQVMSGFIVGGCAHVFLAQIGDALGIKLPSRSGPGYLYTRAIDVIELLPKTNIPTAIISACSVGFLVFSREILEPWLASVFEFPVPYELILLIVGITATNFAGLSDRHSIDVVKNISTDFPPPTLPRFELVPSIFVDSVSIAVIAVAIHLTVTKIVEKRYHYKISSGQELYSLGFVGVFSSFFPVFPVTSVFARSVIGMTVCFSSLVLLAVILFIGPALELLPKCILSSMVIVSLTCSLSKLRELRQLWPMFKVDFMIFIISMLLTICWDMAEGLVAAVIFAVFTTVVRNQFPKWHILAHDENVGDYRETLSKPSYLVGDVCVLRFDGPLIFTSVHKFTKVVYECIKRWEKREANNLRKDDDGCIWRLEERNYRALLVIDCSGFPYVDFLGLCTLKKVYADTSDDGIIVKFAAPKGLFLYNVMTYSF